jgi:hypothetical protein
VSTGRAEVARALTGYTLLRLGLLVAVFLVLYYLPQAFDVEVPLLLAVLLAVVLQLPMAWLLFPAQRHRVGVLLAERSSARGGERARLRAALAGEDAPNDDHDDR